jgi:WXXGXW repeat (2 copies)
MLSAASAAMLAGAAQAQVSVDIRVNLAPPPLPYYEQPVIPAEGYIWVPGFWAWDDAEADYYWVPGTWVEPPQAELLWTPAYWGWVDGRYLFHPGYWGREVGFYGGIDYGFGYSGEGYWGGRWDNGHFFYNRSVNNIENVRITNVYNQTVVVNNRINNVSFNGGNGGTAARATPQQEAIARERHVEATPVQRQHVEAASKDRALFSKQNHGEPAVAATPRPGVFQGAGVSHGSHTPVAARPTGEPNGTERPGAPVNRPMAGQKPAATEPPREAQPRPNSPAIEEQRRPVQEPPRAEEPRRPAEQRPVVEEPRRPAQEPPRVEEPRRPEPPRVEQPRGPAQEPPRVEEQRRPVQEPPRANEMRPAAPKMPERPAAGPPRPPAEQKKRE